MPVSGRIRLEGLSKFGVCCAGSWLDWRRGNSGTVYLAQERGSPLTGASHLRSRGAGAVKPAAHAISKLSPNCIVEGCLTSPTKRSISHYRGLRVSRLGISPKNPEASVRCGCALTLEAVLKNRISNTELWNLIGTAAAPHIVDVRIADDIAENPTLIPGAVQRDYTTANEWGPQFAGGDVVVVCHKGLKLSEGVAAQLRILGIRASVLEGGNVAWKEAGLPAVPLAIIPERQKNVTSWVTRERPKIDRIACPWLIRRFVDPFAEFLFVEASQVRGVAERFNATPFDIDDVFWSHRGDTCTFDTMIAEFGLTSPALKTVAQIVRGADTAQLDLAPQAAGLLAISLGLSKLYDDDLAQLEAGMLIYDALYEWARSAKGETHNWPSQVAS
jgi:rhodanese-related sulfurtransferase